MLTNLKHFRAISADVGFKGVPHLIFAAPQRVVWTYFRNGFAGESLLFHAHRTSADMHSATIRAIPKAIHFIYRRVIAHASSVSIFLRAAASSFSRDVSTSFNMQRKINFRALGGIALILPRPPSLRIAFRETPSLLAYLALENLIGFTTGKRKALQPYPSVIMRPNSSWLTRHLPQCLDSRKKSPFQRTALLKLLPLKKILS